MSVPPIPEGFATITPHLCCDGCADAGADAGVGASPRALVRSPVTMHLHVEDCDATTQQAEAAGAIVTMPAQYTFWGARYGRLRDPFGHEWAVATSIKEESPEEAAAAGEQYFKG